MWSISVLRRTGRAELASVDLIPTNLPMAAAFEFTLRAKAAVELSCVPFHLSDCA